MSRQMRRMRKNVVVLAIQSQNSIHKTCWLPVMWAELILHADAVKQVRPWTRDLSIQWVRRNCKMGKEMGSVLQFVSHVYKHIHGFVSKEHKASVWKIILPDCLPGICHYTRCDWLRYLSGQVKPSCEVV